jgi:hypothetical protein
VTSASKKVVPVGRLYSFWARAEGVPDEVKHYKGICEVQSLIGAVDDVDLQILTDLDVVRLQVDVRSIKKFPMVKQFAVKPWMYNITFSIEKVIEEGNLEEVENVPMDTNQSKDKEQLVDEEVQARATKNQKVLVDVVASCSKTREGAASDDFPVVIMTEMGTVAMPKFNQVINLREKKYTDMSRMEKDQVLAHQMQDKENNLLLQKNGITLGEEDEQKDKEEETKGEEEMEEGLVDFDDS